MTEKKDLKRDIKKFYSNQKDIINMMQNCFDLKKETNKINKIKKKIQTLNNKIKNNGIKKGEISIKNNVFNEFKNINKDNKSINCASVVINKKSNKKILRINVNENFPEKIKINLSEDFHVISNKINNNIIKNKKGEKKKTNVTI